MHEGIGNKKEGGASVHSFLNARIQKYGAGQEKNLRMSDDGESLVYPGEVIKLNAESAIDYAKKIVEYWSIENEKKRIQSGKANFPIDRSKIPNYKPYLGKDTFLILKLLDSDKKVVGVDEHEALKHELSMFDPTYRLAIAEHFLELQGIPLK